MQSTLNALSQTIQAGLEKERLAHGEVSLYGTPRRLAVLIKDLQLQQEDQVLEVKGPPKNIAYDLSLIHILNWVMNQSCIAA